MNFIGPLTPFTAPDHCSTLLNSCSTHNLATIVCTPEYGMTCGPNGTPSSAATCFPNGDALVSTLIPVFSPGEQCPERYTAAYTTSYTTSDDPRWTGGSGSVSYSKAAQVACCPSGYIFFAGDICTRLIPGGASIQYFCDLGSTVSSTVVMPTGSWTYGVITQADSQTSTRIYNVAEAGRVVYISGSVGTGPWPTSTKSSSSRTGAFVPLGTSGGSSGSSTGSRLKAKAKKKNTVKIAVGVAVPVVFAIIAALLLFARKRKKQKPTTEIPDGQSTIQQSEANKPGFISGAVESDQRYGKAELHANTSREPGQQLSDPREILHSADGVQGVASELGTGGQLYRTNELDGVGTAATPQTVANQEPSWVLHGQYTPSTQQSQPPEQPLIVSGTSPQRMNTRDDTQPISELEAPEAKVDEQLTRARHLAQLEEEQARIQSEIERLKLRDNRM